MDVIENLKLIKNYCYGNSEVSIYEYLEENNN